MIEAKRALCLYDLLVIPGLELTTTIPNPSRQATRWRSGCGASSASTRASSTQCALHVSAGRHWLPPIRIRRPTRWGTTRGTAAFAADPERWVPLLDRFELFNRHTLFGWVAEAGLPSVASGDFHVEAHLATWKTLSRARRTSRRSSSTCARAGPRSSSQLDRDEKLRDAA